jgi:hypothetical protein
VTLKSKEVETVDIVKRAYLNTLNHEPDDCPLPEFRQKVREEIVRLVKVRAYRPLDWPREFGPCPDELKSKRK